MYELGEIVNPNNLQIPRGNCSDVHQNKCPLKLTEEEVKAHYEMEDSYLRNTKNPKGIFYCLNIKKSLEEKGWQDDKKDETIIENNEIIEGKHRACIAKIQGWKIIITNKRNTDHDSYEFQVLTKI